MYPSHRDKVFIVSGALFEKRLLFAKALMQKSPSKQRKYLVPNKAEGLPGSFAKEPYYSPKMTRFFCLAPAFPPSRAKEPYHTRYGVATISRLLKIIGLFCRI